MNAKPYEPPQNSFQVERRKTSRDWQRDLSSGLLLCAITAVLLAMSGTSIFREPFDKLNAAEYVALASFGAIGLAALALFARIVTRRYSLRTLVIATAIGPPLLGFMWLFGAALPYAVVALVYLVFALLAFAFVAAAAVSIPFVFGWVFSLIARALLYVGRHPDNRQ